jgi:hypothetical protein
MVTFLHVFSVYYDMFNRTHGIMRTLPEKLFQWKGYIDFTVKFAYQKLFKYYSEVTPVMGISLNTNHMIDSCRKL